MKNGKIIPKHLHIETINGVCTAQCIMCAIDKWTRKPYCMTIEEFKIVISKFVPYIDHLEYLSLFGSGEPLLDRALPEKIAIASRLGFRGIGFATNCTELDEKRSLQLIKSGLNTIICSIDGIEKETHEAIRRKTNFESIVHNIKTFINIRNSIPGVPTRILIRFIRQKLNWDEWPAFYTEWINCINPEKGDDVILFEAHNCGGDLDENVRNNNGNETKSKNLICTDIFERFFVFSNGDVGFCCADYNGLFRLGNIIKDDPVEVFNNTMFSKYRMFMKAGKINELAHCKKCTIVQSQLTKTSPARKHAV